MRSSTRDVVYLANVTIDGNSFPLQMDTGSSDLWVDMGSFQAPNPVSAFGRSYGANCIDRQVSLSSRQSPIISLMELGGHMVRLREDQYRLQGEFSLVCLAPFSAYPRF